MPALREDAVAAWRRAEARVYPTVMVDAAIYALRKKIDEPGKPSLVETRRGMGYILRRPAITDAGSGANRQAAV